MSDVTFLSTDTIALSQRLISAERSLTFIQREHASTLTDLHEEVSKWQQRCSDLTFQLAIGGTVINPTDDSKLRTRVQQLETQLSQCKDKIKGLSTILKEKENLANEYENRLTVNERQHALELHAQYEKQRELKIELEKRSTLIAQLTNQLHREKQHQHHLSNRIRLGQIILPNKPTKFRNNDEQQNYTPPARRQSNRSSSLHSRTGPDQELTRVLFVGRPPTPPSQCKVLSPRTLEASDEQVYTRRQRQLIDNHMKNLDLTKVTSSRPTIKLSPILPPIVKRKMPLKAFAASTLQREGEA